MSGVGGLTLARLKGSFPRSSADFHRRSSPQCDDDTADL